MLVNEVLTLLYCVFQTLAEIDQWGIDIFRIGELSNNRPLTCVAYTAFQVRNIKQLTNIER